MPGKAVGFAAVDLPWLCPETDSLIALAENPANLGQWCSIDIALTLFLYRFAQPAAEPDTFGFAPGAFLTPTLPETAAAYLASTRHGVLPYENSSVQRLLAVIDHAASIAKALASATRLTPPVVAERLTRIAPLGWYAVAAVDPLAVADALADPDHPRQPERIQTELWGLDHRSIARRLAMRWRLPVWMSDTISSLSLPLHVANKLVSHPKLFAIVQLALVLAQERSLQLGLTHGVDQDQLREAVQVDDATLERLTTAPTDRQPTRSRSQYPRNPLSVPLLPSLLRLAGQSRRRNGAALILELENRIDRLYEAVGEIGIEQDNQLRDAKLAGLAELAAGAGHEINNPLAVISGNAQRLLRSEQDPQRRESLNAIIRQSNRIAGLLRELMEFARPPRPVPRLFSISELFRSVEQELAPFASERQVQLRFQLAGHHEWVHADYQQVTRSLVAVVRNAIEATPAQGVVQVTMTNAESCNVVIAVEDTGPGLATDVALHAFDPFYCGRRAGRGRGLGLPTAWRLLQQNGGSIHYLPTAEACTRFVLKLKAAASEHFNGRQSA